MDFRYTLRVRYVLPLDMPCGARGDLDHIEAQLYRMGLPIYRFCASKNIDKTPPTFVGGVTIYQNDNRRGEPRSPAEKHSFSDFPKENTVFLPCGDGFCSNKIRGRPRVAPTDVFLTRANAPNDSWGRSVMHFRLQRSAVPCRCGSWSGAAASPGCTGRSAPPPPRRPR